VIAYWAGAEAQVDEILMVFKTLLEFPNYQQLVPTILPANNMSIKA
jgi:hypothetical protein